MKTSESIAKIAPAFIKAQAKIKSALKDSNNPHFKSKYADFESVVDAYRSAFLEHEIGVIQSPGLLQDGKMHLVTRLQHSSGEYYEGELSIPLSKIDAQSYGSAVTYAKRYAVAAMTGVVTSDDDGNAASEKAEPAFKTAKQLSEWHKTMIDLIIRAPDMDELKKLYKDNEKTILALQANKSTTPGHLTNDEIAAEDIMHAFTERKGFLEKEKSGE